jgi:uroporphyrinogen decarboxylase
MIDSAKKDELLPRERVLEALALREPDRVPWVEIDVDQVIVDSILDLRKSNVTVPVGYHKRDVEQEKAFSRRVGKDNIMFPVRPPLFCDFLVGKDGRQFCEKGHLRTRDDLDKMVLPDIGDGSYFQDAEEFVKKKDEFAAIAVTRLGIAAVMLSLGMEVFFEMVHDDMDFVLEIQDRYTQWLSKSMEIVSNTGFDCVCAADDLAFKTGPMFSPKMFEEYFLPGMRKVADSISLPWFTHSDGDMSLLMDAWLTLGQNGINPIEPLAMNINQVKKEYGMRICLIGNVDVDLLATGTPAEVDEVVRMLIRDIAPKGGYILSSGNSIPSFSKVENVMAMSEALKKYGRYPISLE